MRRNDLIKMIHMGARRQGWDDSTYRTWIEKHTGRRSCADCSDDQLSLLADDLRDIGALDRPGASAVPAASDPNRPTQKQWRMMLDMSRKCGLSGAATDPGLRTLCARVAKIDNPRFLDKAGMHAMISALQRWHKYKVVKAAMSIDGTSHSAKSASQQPT